MKVNLILLLRMSAALTLLALGLMVWSMLEPTPMPVMIAMTVGQAFGTLAFGAYGFVVWRDLVRRRQAARISLNLDEAAAQAVARSDAASARVDGETAKDVTKEVAKDVTKEPANGPAEATAQPADPASAPAAEKDDAS